MLLLDTNIVSFFFKQNRLGDLYFPLVVGKEALISFQTLVEMLEGSKLAKWSTVKKQKLIDFLQQYSVLQSDQVLCDLWAEVRSIRHTQPISVADAWIAATALSYDLDLVTHNPKDCQSIPGLRIVTAAKR